jgi:two-component system sensor histidine kinase AlgZ
VWVAAGAGIAGVIGVAPAFTGALERYRLDVPYVTVIGALVFFSVTMLHYVLISLDDARAAEGAALEAAYRRRDAELRALRAQIHPHFLFNGLNAIASLAGSDPVRARAMCVMLAEFFRTSMTLGSHHEIPLGEELDLARRYLEIERVRFGDRLRLETAADADALACSVPALLLQPLVENAVTHGIAHSIAGGIVRLAARCEAGRLMIDIENPADPDRPPSRGQGVGVTNVRAQLASLHPGATRVECREAAGRFTVEIVLPAVARAPHAATTPPDAAEVA